MVGSPRSRIPLTGIRAVPPHPRDHQAWSVPRRACEPAPRPHLVSMSTQPTHDPIVALADRFSDRIQVPPTPGQVFNASVDDWAEHTRPLASVWTPVVLRARHTSSNPTPTARPPPTTP